MKKAVFTIVNTDYLSRSLTMLRSFSEFNQNYEKYVVLFDYYKISQDFINYLKSDYSINLISIDELNIAEEQIQDLFLKYNVTEFATSIKPTVFLHLFKKEYNEITYLDPDIYFFDTLPNFSGKDDEVIGILTPHSLELPPFDNLKIRPGDILNAGVFNLGFLILFKNSIDFLNWWQQNTFEACYQDKLTGIFTDQKYFDFAILKYQFIIEKTKSLNVAYWNLHERNIELKNNKFYVDDLPLIFFHFSGFVPDESYLISKHTLPNPRILMSDNETLELLYTFYKEQLNFEFKNLNQIPNGLKLSKKIINFLQTKLDIELLKLIYTEIYISNSNLTQIYSFKQFLDHNRDNILKLIYQIFPDLRIAFSQNLNSLIEWVERSADSRTQLFNGINIKNSIKKSSIHPKNIWNLIGYYNAQTGVGEFGRDFVDTFSKTHLKYVKYLLTDFNSSVINNQLSKHSGYVPSNSLNIWNCNLDQIKFIRSNFGHKENDFGINIGTFFWELDTLNLNQLDNLSWVNGIWVSSKFTKNSFEKFFNGPIEIIPPVININYRNKTESKIKLNLPKDKFIVLSVFDFNSVIERKNPYGSIESFLTAFEDNPDVLLIMKSINYDSNIHEFEKFNSFCKKFANIRHIASNYDNSEMDYLYCASDVFLSLHRSEGLGLNMLKAMKVGLPVIATDYSANIDYLSNSNGYLVDFDLIEVKKFIKDSQHPYFVDTTWANPNIESASKHLIKIFNGEPSVKEKVNQAINDVNLFTNPIRRIEFIRNELCE